MAVEPALWFRGKDEELEILPGPLGDRGWLDRARACDPGAGLAFERLQAIARGMWPERGLRAVGGARFRGGLAGFFSYDLGRRFERVPERLPDADVPWDFVLGLYDEVLAIDGRTGGRRVFRLPGTAPRIQRGDRLLPPDLGEDVPGALLPPRPELSRSEHAAAVRAIREHIVAGTIYQANLTLRFAAPSTHPRAPLATFLRLQRGNPAPYSAYLDLPGLALVSTSPECFLELDADGGACSRPIKGTRSRERGDADAAAAAALLASEKDRAELTMIVDLVRNDLGRACALGSVSRAPELRCEAHPTVWHLVADVRGQLRLGLDGFDLLRASFPPGSCIGAPKIRAMQVIESLERSRRGPYTGAIGWLGADGALGLSVAIRTLVFREGRVSYGVGGGIVFDSEPQQEWEEALLKGRALARALAVRDGGQEEAPDLPLTSATPTRN